MKKITVVLLAFIVAASALLCTGCSDEKLEELEELNAVPVSEADQIPDICSSPNRQYELALCVSGTLLKDRSFNEYCYNGVKLFAKEHDKTYKYYIPPKQATDADNYSCIVAAVANGAKVVVAVGYEYGNPLKEAAKNFPDVKFIFIDGWSTGDDNVIGVSFKENEGGYLAGYSAVKEGLTRLGFVGGGGGSNEACNRYGRGFVCGAEDAAKELGIKVEMNYTYQYASTYTSSPELQAMTDAWYTNGTEVIFTAAGAGQDCIASAASANDAWIIACDADASARSRSVIASVLKRTDVATQAALELCYSDQWDNYKGTAVSLGVAEDCVGMATDTWRYENFTVEEYEELMDRIRSGEIKIDTDDDNNCSSEWLNYRYM